MLWAWQKFYSSVVDKWLKCLSTFFVFLQCSCCKTQPVTPKEDELTELIVAFLTNRRDQQRQKGEGEKKKKIKPSPTKTKKKKKKATEKFFVGQVLNERGRKKRETCKATQLKWLPQRVFIPGVHGKNPSGTAATASHGSSWKVSAWRRGGERLDREESQLFSRWKAKSPGGAAPWCVGHIKIFDRLQHYEKKKPSVLSLFFSFFPPERFCFSSHRRPVTLPSGPLTGPCHCLGPESSKRAF